MKTKQKTHHKYKIGDYIRVINTNIFSHSIKKGDIGKVVLVNDDSIELMFDYYLIQDVYLTLISTLKRSKSTWTIYSMRTIASKKN